MINFSEVLSYKRKEAANKMLIGDPFQFSILINTVKVKGLAAA